MLSSGKYRWESNDLIIIIIIIIILIIIMIIIIIVIIIIMIVVSGKEKLEQPPLRTNISFSLECRNGKEVI